MSEIPVCPKCKPPSPLLLGDGFWNCQYCGHFQAGPTTKEQVVTLAAEIRRLTAEMATSQAALDTARAEEREACLKAMPPKLEPEECINRYDHGYRVGWNAGVEDAEWAILQRGAK